MNAADQLVEALVAEGVEYVFGIPGDENLQFTEALRENGRIKFILTRHEQAAGFMAAAEDLGFQLDCLLRCARCAQGAQGCGHRAARPCRSSHYCSSMQ